MSITWKFVDQPIASPATLLDMNDKVNYAINMEKGFDISPPVLRKSVSGNSMADGGRLTSAAFENRLLRFTVTIMPQTNGMKELLLTELNVELGKASNLIMYKPQASSEPVFFQTIRSDSYVLDHRGGSKKMWNVACEVEAESFGIGLRQTLISNATITNNPASGANPARIDLTGVEGDVPSPAFIRLGTSFSAGSIFLLGQKTDQATSLNPFVQCEAGTQGTDTTTQANDALYSGSGNNFSRCTFGTTATLATRVTNVLPTNLRGTYRVYVRARSAVGTNRYQVRAHYPGASGFSGPLLEFVTTAQAFMLLDLGVMDFPFPAPTPPQFGYSRLTGTYPNQSIDIRAARPAGTGVLDFDYLYLMPADERLGTFQAVAATGFLIIDGQQEKAYGMTSASDPFGGTRVVDSAGAVVPLFGGGPMLVPGVTNRWFMLRTKTGDAVATTTSLWVDYWPQWRVVAIP